MIKIGIDLDDTITFSQESLDFFRLLTHAFIGKAEIFIITSRIDSEEGYTKTEQELAMFGIVYDHLIITSYKSDFIIDNNISIFFDDTDENFQKLPENITVFKIREGGNFDFKDGKWIYGDNTGKKI